MRLINDDKIRIKWTIPDYYKEDTSEKRNWLYEYYLMLVRENRNKKINRLKEKINANKKKTI